MKKTIVVYHKDCPDGVTAAWAAYKKLGDTADYVAMHYDYPVDIEQFRSREVYLVDFSFSLADTERVASVATSVTILDHHKSALENLAGTPFAELLDMTKSGARLSWDYFHPNTDIPVLVQYVEDHDLWKHQMPDWEAVRVVMEMEDLSSREALFSVWGNLADTLQNPVSRDSLIEKGKSILEYRRVLIERICRSPGYCLLAGYKVPCINSGIWQSEIGNVLARNAPFSVIWRAGKDGKILYSLRSDDASALVVDVSKIAKAFGGGGHRNAAGFVSNSPPMMVAIL